MVSVRRLCSEWVRLPPSESSFSPVSGKLVLWKPLGHCFAGICFQWHNVWVLVTVPVNWIIMTVTLKLTEEKWLLDLYGQDYADYRKRVNRCIPWPPRKASRE